MHTRAVAILGAFVALSLPSSSPAKESTPAPPQWTTYSRAGIAVTLPQGWRVVHRRLTPCTDPTERLTVMGRGALVMLQERLVPVAGEFAPRPSLFRLRGRPQFIECCAPLRRPGWFFNFAEGRRGFYVYLYLGGSETRAEALRILDSLRVRPNS